MNLSEARTIVIGASGQVGQQLARTLRAPLCTARESSEEGWIALDLALGAELRRPLTELLQKEGIKAVFCAGGATNVEACESEPDLTFRTNVEGPQAAAIAARTCGAAFVYFSTEYVFDGRAGPYSEGDQPNPKSVYGKSKWAGEQAVREAHSDALIIRTTVVYGPDRREKNFLYSLIRTLESGREFRVASDQYSTPTYNLDLAEAVVALLDHGAKGVFNVVGPSVISRLEFSQIFAAALKLPAEFIREMDTASLGQIAPRPLRAGLTTEKLRSALPHLRMRAPLEGIEDWIRKESLL